MHYKKFNISAVSYKVKLNVKEENFPLNRKNKFQRWSTTAVGNTKIFCISARYHVQRCLTFQLKNLCLKINFMLKSAEKFLKFINYVL